MKDKVKALLANKQKTIPILSFPATALLGVSVEELLSTPEMQAAGMEAIRARCPVGASLSMMDLSVEAEAFGAKVRFLPEEIPTVEDGILTDVEDADSVVVPAVGAGRTGLCVEGVRLAKAQTPDIPVLCGVIGPYSLACRLLDMTELMLACYDSPDEVKALVGKAAAFLTAYIQAFQAAGADGVMMAEPAAGLLSPALAAEFSTPFVEQIFAAVNREDFILGYHNCGNAAGDMVADLATTCSDIFHFGNAIDVAKVLAEMPADKVVMGNIDPVLLRTGTPEEIRAAVEAVYASCGHYENFMLSTGCDVPADAKWENIDAYFAAVEAVYA